MCSAIYNEYCDHYTDHSNVYTIGPLCQNSTAPILPGTSNNGITGTWSPATISTATAGTTTYTFTPAAGQCALPFTMNIVITTQITPTFTQLGPLCQNSTAPALPGTSNNGITGTWSPCNYQYCNCRYHYLYIYSGKWSVCGKYTMTIVVTPEIIATPVVTNTTCTASMGAINITVSGGTSPYTYLWSNGATTEDISGLDAGTYTVTITDVNGCTTNLPFSVAANSVTVIATPVVTNTTCTASIGAINLTVSGGTSPYTYLWSNGATTEDISGLAAGNYTVTITDANGCTTNLPFTVGTDNVTITATPVVTNTTCTASIGAINITVSGGTSPYTYLWSNGATTEDITGLAAGTYTVTITDANGCTTNMPIYCGN